LTSHQNTFFYNYRRPIVHFVYNSDITLYSQRKVSTPEISPFFTLRPNKKDLSFSEKSLMVEHLENTSPLIFEEITRW
jgi:hypothetical protein